MQSQTARGKVLMGGDGEMAQLGSTLVPLAEDLDLVLPTLGSPKLPVIPVPGTLIPSSGSQGRPHCVGCILIARHSFGCQSILWPLTVSVTQPH